MLPGVLALVLPPLLGAIIGYVTNYLAIRMLFRPLTERRLLGIRLPLTPGIIPRQRYQLSESIARMVSTKLLTEDTLATKLQDPAFRENLERSVASFTAELLDRTPTPQDSPESTREGVHEVITAVLHGFLISEAFRDTARQVVGSAVEGVLKAPLSMVDPGEERLHALVGRAVHAVSGGQSADAIRVAVRRWIERHVEEDTPLHEVVGPNILKRVADLLPRAYDPILDSLVSFLRRPETRRELAFHGRVLVKRIISRLSGIQRLLVSATQYDRNLNESMPDIVRDVIDSMEQAGQNPENRARIVEVFRSRLSQWSETGVGALSASLAVDLPEVADRAVEAGLELLGREDVHERMTASIAGFLERRGDDPIGMILGDTTGLDEAGIRERASSLVDRWLATPGVPARVAERVTAFVRRFLTTARGEPLRTYLPLDESQKRRIDGLLADRLQGQIARRVPELLAGLDVHGMVVRKIDALDVESVEQLLLMVIARHLKWINLFGALLGALIGGIQVVLSRLI